MKLKKRRDVPVPHQNIKRHFSPAQFLNWQYLCLYYCVKTDQTGFTAAASSLCILMTVQKSAEKITLADCSPSRSVFLLPVKHNRGGHFQQPSRSYTPSSSERERLKQNTVSGDALGWHQRIHHVIKKHFKMASTLLMIKICLKAPYSANINLPLFFNNGMCL